MIANYTNFRSSVRRAALVLLLSAAAILLVVPAFHTAVAQQSTAISGGLSGTVTDPTGAVIPGATVTLTGPQGTRVLKTDAGGRWAASGLTSGYYDITVEDSGFNKVESKHNEVVVNVSSTLNLTLQPGSAGQTVEVSTTAVGIDTSSTAINTNLTDTFYNSIPMARNVTAIFYVAPGVVGGQVAGTPNQNGPGSANPSIGGASGLENLYVVDGVTITDQAFGSIGTYNRYHGSLGTGINLAFIKEVDIKSDAFEPQYGKALGGIVQIVTKSGSNTYHGALGAYFGPGNWYASRYQFYQFGYQETSPSQTLASPQYDVAAEFGGYVPHLRNKLFFFGAFDPALIQNTNFANPVSTVTFGHGPYEYSTTTLSWAGKLTYNLNDKTSIEAATFADPSRHNAVPTTLATPNPFSVTSSYQFGSRDSFFRVATAISPSWLVDASFTYNYNHFNESPAINTYQVTDQSGQSLANPIASSTTGFGPYEPSKNDTYSIAADTSKIVNFHGQHTFSVGYAYDHTNFLDQPTRSGNLFAIPGTNANGQDLSKLFTIPSGAIGSLTNAQFTVVATNADANLTTTDRTCSKCPVNSHGQQVYAGIIRGTYVGLNVQADSRYHSAYGEDVYQMNQYVTLDAGVRWEEQHIGGDLLKYAFTGNWSPRIGINIDPFADRKGKFFFNFGRNFWALPLDAAIRQLGNEHDDTSYYFAPVVNADGTYTVIPDSAHTLNGLPKKTDASGTVANFGGPSFTSSTGEGIIPGTKAEFENEYVIGVEREVANGVVLKGRYTDRRLGRVIEDIGSQSPEGSTIGSNYNGGIANPSGSTDYFVNEQEVTYTQAQFLAKNPGKTTKGNYVAPVAGCTASNDTFFAVGGPFINGRSQPVGGGCFTNLATMGSLGADGKPDGFVNPIRRYQAVELEVDKRFNNHWLAQINYRWGTLFGNYEGAYRNDNGQSDPGISSLFDFTAGQLGLLGDQFTPGDLSSDRRNVGNLFLSYSVGSDSPFIHRARGLTTGVGFRGQSGVPLSFLGDHPIYLNQGEIPLGGRGAAGRTPVSMQLDLHAAYPMSLGERYKINFAIDAFNVTNSQFVTAKEQYTQVTASGVGVAPNLNLDYGRPTSFQGPLYARGTIRFEF